MNAYALAAEDGTITLIVVTPAQTFEFSLTDPQTLADTLRRAMAESEIRNAILLKPQPKDFELEGWSI